MYKYPWVITADLSKYDSHNKELQRLLVDITLL